MAIPDLNALKAAVKAALYVDTGLTDLVLGIVNGRVPEIIEDPVTLAQVEHDWEQPILEWGIQVDEDDLRNAYSQEGLRVELRMIAHDRGEYPGQVNFDDCHDALRAAHVALTAMSRSFSGWKVWRLRRMRGTGETIEDDSGAYAYVNVGAVYEVRIV